MRQLEELTLVSQMPNRWYLRGFYFSLRINADYLDSWRLYNFIYLFIIIKSGRRENQTLELASAIGLQGFWWQKFIWYKIIRTNFFGEICFYNDINLRKNSHIEQKEKKKNYKKCTRYTLNFKKTKCWP